MKRIILIIGIILFSHLYCDFFEENDKNLEQFEKNEKEKLDKINSQINDKTAQSVLAVGNMTATLASENPGKVAIAGGIVVESVKELVSLLKEKYEATKNIEEKREIYKMLMEYDEECFFQDHIEIREHESFDTSLGGEIR